MWLLSFNRISQFVNSSERLKHVNICLMSVHTDTLTISNRDFKHLLSESLHVNQLRLNIKMDMLHTRLQYIVSEKTML